MCGMALGIGNSVCVHSEQKKRGEEGKEMEEKCSRGTTAELTMVDRGKREEAEERAEDKTKTEAGIR